MGPAICSSRSLDDPLVVLATQRDHDWQSAPSALTRSLCDILKDETLKRYGDGRDRPRGAPRSPAVRRNVFIGA